MPILWQVIHPTQGMAILYCCLRIWQILINFPESTVGITIHFVNVEEADLQMRKREAVGSYSSKLTNLGTFLSHLQG